MSERYLTPEDVRKMAEASPPRRLLVEPPDEEPPPPCQSPTCDLNLSACICGNPFGEETSA